MIELINTPAHTSGYPYCASCGHPIKHSLCIKYTNSIYVQYYCLECWSNFHILFEHYNEIITNNIENKWHIL